MAKLNVTIGRDDMLLYRLKQAGFPYNNGKEITSEAIMSELPPKCFLKYDSGVKRFELIWDEISNKYWLDLELIKNIDSLKNSDFGKPFRLIK